MPRAESLYLFYSFHIVYNVTLYLTESCIQFVLYSIFYSGFTLISVRVIVLEEHNSHKCNIRENNLPCLNGCDCWLTTYLNAFNELGALSPIYFYGLLTVSI